jgi:hypothetical protein
MIFFAPMMMFSAAIVTTHMMALMMVPYSSTTIPNLKVKAKVYSITDGKEIKQ